MKTAVIYCRESQLSKLPTDVIFDDQELSCRDYAKENGYQVFKVYRESHSGADLLNRPLIWEAIDDVRRGDAQTILVRNFDRLARKPEHQAVILYEVEQKYRGRVESALEKVDQEDNTQSQTMRNVLAVVAESERLNAVARMERGKMRRAERGSLMGAGHPRFGYAWLDDEPGKRTAYVIDPETGPIVQRIFQLAASGQSLRAISRLLNAEGIPTPAQWHAKNGHLGRAPVGRHWVPEQLSRIIYDRTYTGEGVAFKRQNTKKNNGKYAVTIRPDDDPKRITLSVPALVSVETFDAVGRTIHGRDSTGRPPVDREATWLRKHVWCGVCGHRMHVGWSQNHYRYQCSRRSKPEGCAGGNFGIHADLLDQKAHEALCYVLMRREQVRELMLNRLGKGKLEQLVAMAEGFQAQLQDKREEMDLARRRASQTRDDELAEEFIKDAEKLNAEIHMLERDYEDAREMLENFDSGHKWVEITLQRIYEHNPMRPIPTVEDVKAFPYEERRLLLVATGLRVEVFPKTYPNRIEVYFNWELDKQMSLNMFGG